MLPYLHVEDMVTAVELVVGENLEALGDRERRSLDDSVDSNKGGGRSRNCVTLSLNQIIILILSLFVVCDVRLNAPCSLNRKRMYFLKSRFLFLCSRFNLQVVARDGLLLGILNSTFVDQRIVSICMSVLIRFAVDQVGYLNTLVVVRN